MPNWKNLDKVAALAGGCVAFASGAGTAGLAVGAAGGGAGLLGAWWDKRAKHGLESGRLLETIRAKVLKEFGDGSTLTVAQAALLEGADHSLGEELLNCMPSPAALALAMGEPEGFAKAATKLVLANLSSRDDLFSADGERADPLARQFAETTIEVALESALVDKDYFAQLLPHALGSIGGDVRRTHAEILQVGAEVADIKDEVKSLVRHLKEGGKLESAKKVGIAEVAWIELARRIAEEVADPDQAFRELDRSINDLILLRQEASKGTNLGGVVDQSLRRAADKAAVGLFEEASAEVDLGLAMLDRKEEDLREGFKQSRLKLIDEGVRQDTLRRDARAVARRLLSKLKISESSLDDLTPLMRDVEEWTDRGDEAGLNFELEVAVALARLGSSVSDNTLNRGELERLGAIALMKLGSRQRDIFLLGDAVHRLEALLSDAECQKDLEFGARVNHSLGTALWRFGEQHRQTGILEKAAGAFHMALEVRRRERDPREWAMTQAGLANVYNSLGEMTEDPKWLMKAVTAYSLALRELDAIAESSTYADLQHDMGTAFHTLGEVTGDRDHLEQAVAAYDVALQERSRSRRPIRWAATTLSRVLALAQIAEHSRDAGPLAAAAELAISASAYLKSTEHKNYVGWADFVIKELARVTSSLRP